MHNPIGLSWNDAVEEQISVCSTAVLVLAGCEVMVHFLTFKT